MRLSCFRCCTASASSIRSAIAAAFFILTNAALGAEITTEIRDDVRLIRISGELGPDDDTKFNEVAQKYSNALVIFDSAGGNLFAGMAIGEAIRLKGFGTGVAKSSVCASACALAWLGGIRRYVDPGAKLGFHAAYTIDGSQARETGLGNAVVGAYLTRIGLPLSAVVYITKAKPEDMTWLTPEEGKKVGIEFKVVGIEPRSPASVQESSPSPVAPPPVAPKPVVTQSAPPIQPSTASPSQRRAAYKMEGGKVVELTNLSDPCDLTSARNQFSGKVVRTEYAPDALSVKGFVVEVQDGSRTYINVGPFDDLDMATLGAVKKGLQVMLQTGKAISGEVWACGAAGRALNLDVLRVDQSAVPTSAPADSAAFAKRIAQNFDKQYKQSGMIGMRTSVEACYARAREVLKLSVIQYCYVLDQLASGFDASFSKSLHFPPDAYWRREAAIARSVQVLAQILPDQSAQVQTIRGWAPLVNAAFKELAALPSTQP